ncbi:hypothetical protein BV360_01600 [Pseudomonas syringae pv. actinidiae]|uniref:Predicted nicotinamide N-methyase n=1 Tax=Pseudomonas syringae pv. actinidiae TaxID=103796 RepID=A0AAN4TJ47_PSESF|nr:hypothetical protein BV340_01492 [Pseudomonas syringae pv. actinidiae]OSN23262.1 hypothetical protein BV339_01384 [Pseudomonas syringae pv. actinidiae]OSN27727.1 hypothetical protein BV341_01419 [Pseudomonas syringae pv. actinidiae]OSN37057.1 hypothetical protein BV343_01269 [Pseudomonas syringae pv. actinidiae]OSN38726.1 hypothetical protein BV342_01614 [Pseudomonas syringae pv. actinidiae]
MIAPQHLQHALSELLGDARLAVTALPGTELKLWLIDEANMDRAFSPDETRRISGRPTVLELLLGEWPGPGAFSG